MRARQASRLVFAFVMILMSASVHAQVLNNEVEFYGTISDVALKGDAEGTAFVDIGGFDLRVIVNPRTELMDLSKNPMTLDALAGLKDKTVLVSGKFSSSGVLATRIEVVGTDDNNSFEVSGHITAIQPGTPTLISLLGLTIQAASVPDGLKIGDWVSIEGTVAGSTWTATSIKMVDPGKKKGTLHFEGVVDSWAGGLLGVKVTGATGPPTIVHVTPETRVTGELDEGVYVAVKGKLVNFEVQATQVEVIGPFEIKPDERKLKVGETADFTVKLREVAPTGGVPVTIKVETGSASISLVSPVPDKVAAGERTVSFSVKASSTEGIGTISVEALGTKLTATVTVGAISEIDNERPTGDVRIAFAPDHIKMGPNDSREVVLIVQPPQEGTVSFEVTPAGAGVTVSESPDHTLGEGAARMKALVTSSEKPADSVKITATLGTAKAELLVDLTGKGKKQ